MPPANRELHVVAGVVIFPTHPGPHVNLLRVGKTLCAKATVREENHVPSESLRCLLLQGSGFMGIRPWVREIWFHEQGPRGVFGPFEDSFPIVIPARPGKILAIREFHVMHECVFFPTCPGSRINLLRVRKTLRASVATSVGKFRKFSAQTLFRRPVFTRVVDVAPDVGFRRSWYRRKACATYFSTVQALHRGELGFARYDLANRGRRNVPYAKGFDHNSLVSRPFLARKVSNRSSHHVLQNGQGAVSSIQFSVWSTVRSNLGQPWSNLVEFGQSSPKSGKCIPDHVLRISRPYFQAHSIIVLTDYPIRKAMNKPYAVGKLVQWSIEMSEFNIDYRPRTAIKAQALVNFIAEFTHLWKEEDELEKDEVWTVSIDGSSTKDMGGARIVLVSPEKDQFEYAIQLCFRAINNEAEYEALLVRLKLSRNMGIKNLIVQSDSQLIVGQVKGEYEAREDRMKKYLTIVQTLLPHFKKVEFFQIPTDVDGLARLASSEEEIDGFLEVQGRPSTEEETMNSIIDSASWMSPIIRYLKNGKLPTNKTEARKLKIRASHFQLLGGTLYKMGFARPHLRCLSPEEANYAIREVHEGVCGNHSGARALAHKLTRAGYYWPSLLHDATQYVKTLRQKQGKKAKYYNTKVKHQRFEVDNWVLRKVTQATKDPSQGKLAPNWEGPYKVTQYYRRGTYLLEDRHGKCFLIPGTLNISKSTTLEVHTPSHVLR
uniref:RNase H type-1 domain-containing protein n=1 Tax=Fagus sylvatica TaxID=28930 RepID=A0A2N9H2C8_FAGSY